MKHPDQVEKWDGSMKELAHAVARMRYDKVQEFILLLAKEVFEDSLKDSQCGRKKLGDELYKCSQLLFRVSKRFDDVCAICKTKDVLD